MECDSVSLGKKFLTFRQFVVPLFSGSSSPRIFTHWHRSEDWLCVLCHPKRKISSPFFILTDLGYNKL